MQCHRGLPAVRGVAYGAGCPRPATASLFSAYGRGIDKQGDYVYLAIGSALQVIDVSTPAAPVVVGEWVGSAYDVTVYGSRAYVETSNDGIYSIDISVPTNPILAGEVVPRQGGFTGLETDSGYLYVTQHNQGFTVYDLAQPAAPVQLAYLGGLSRGLAVADGFAAVVGVGVELVDLSNPAQPYVSGSYRTVKFQGMAVVDNVAYLACALDGLQAVDLEIVSPVDPANPVGVGSLAFSSFQS